MGNNKSGYGNITDCKKYLEEKYGGKVELISEKSLEMRCFTTKVFESEEKNCSLTAITRVLAYYGDKGYAGIEKSVPDIYKTVKSTAWGNGYTLKRGTNPTKIDNIIKKVLGGYGYKKAKCRGIYAWGFKPEVKKEIDADRPVIMNITRGYYAKHSVTVCGYKIYKVTKKWLFGSRKINGYMIEVYDGWSEKKKYIDYKLFADDLINYGIGSFNTLNMCE